MKQALFFNFLYFWIANGLQVNVDVLKIKSDYKFTCKWYRDWVMYDDYGKNEFKQGLF